MADVLFKVRAPEADEIKALKSGAVVCALLDAFRETDVVKVVDFGAAKLQAGLDGHTATVTGMIGTPVYMAPERLLEPSTVAERTAASTQWLCRAGAIESNETSPHSGAWLRQRRGTSPPEDLSKNPTPQPSAFIRPCFWRRGAYDCTRSPHGGSSTSEETVTSAPSHPR